MNKSILVGLIAGAILGVVEMLFLYNGLITLIIIAALGAAIGFARTQNISLNSYVLSALVGAAFFILIAAKQGGGVAGWLDEIATGAITGLVIGLLIPFVDKQLK